MSGPPRAGKTSLVNSLLGHAFENTPSTRGMNQSTISICDESFSRTVKELDSGHWIRYDEPEKYKYM